VWAVGLILAGKAWLVAGRGRIGAVGVKARRAPGAHGGARSAWSGRAGDRHGDRGPQEVRERGAKRDLFQLMEERGRGSRDDTSGVWGARREAGGEWRQGSTRQSGESGSGVGISGPRFNLRITRRWSHRTARMGVRVGER